MRLYLAPPKLIEPQIAYDDLIKLEGGSRALLNVNTQAPEDTESDDIEPVPSRRGWPPKSSSRTTSIPSGFDSSDDEISTMQPSRRINKRRNLESFGKASSGRSSRLRGSPPQLSLDSMSETSSDDYDSSRRGRRKTGMNGSRSTRAAAQKNVNYSDLAALQSESEDSDHSSRLRKRKRNSSANVGSRKVSKLRDSRKASPERRVGSRKSGRSTQQIGAMREMGEDEIPDKATASNAPKYLGAKESFKKLASNDEFRLRHCQNCDTCYESGDIDEKGRLVFCQSCSLSYHHKCLGPRNSRDHLVTKIDDKDFVLQCRRCVRSPKYKDPLAPDQGKCFSCHHSSPSSAPFRERKSIREEQREREENGDQDPIVLVPQEKINLPKNVLFRCMQCFRACHFHHLEPQKSSILSEDIDETTTADQRFSEYCRDWICKTCSTAPAELDSLIAWRPLDIATYEAGTTTDRVEEDIKEYLVKWENLPYTDVKWMPGAWVWGVTAVSMRKAFVKRDNYENLPKMTTEDALPEEFMRVDIVFDVEYTSIVKTNNIDVEKATEVEKKRIKEIKRAFVKFKGLGYEDVVWIGPPSPSEEERYKDFQAAYEDWVLGLHVSPPSTKALTSHLNSVRSKGFTQLVQQPQNLIGGKLMDYQMDGLNWLYYQWFKRQNAILADEMGLGKTIQVIGFLSTLKEKHACWPCLVVVPNSTCPNWRREIKQWDPSLRVVTYYGSAEARRLARKYELFPQGPRDLRCHIVVTSYDAAQETEFRTVFRGINWASLIVDEGQRLKNDKNILYGALNALKAPFKLLLTGTPLQNNPRELFNLLQFLDPSKNAEELEAQYEVLTKENVQELHEMLRPFFLRRTKAQVLTFLPSMAQIIVPVTLTKLQKKLYISILAKNPELIKSILGASKGSLKQTERTNLNNILMQLRKVLCHPFVYSQEIEERSQNKLQLHRGLVEASSKLKLLEIMLPKLKERGHRVLIFSQFLNMLDIVEDFLDRLGLHYERLDGNIGSLQKQKRIDQFNAPDSPLFAFLLSTRAGGVGINLATADTVIILDPDFNPHQDIQALSRAHRIGQKKKVLVFQLTTRSTAEEKIMQVGKKKMALDHVLIEQMDAEEDAGLDLESILRHGTEALFTDEGEDELNYDSTSVDKLLDRSQVEDTQVGKDTSAESQFSFARVWVNDKGTLEDGMEDAPERPPDPSIWDNILKQREREAAEEKAARAQDFGRGRRKRQMIDYTQQVGTNLGSSPARKGGTRSSGSDEETDFQGSEADSDGDADMPDDNDEDMAKDLDESEPRRASRGLVGSQFPPVESRGESFSFHTCA